MATLMFIVEIQRKRKISQQLMWVMFLKLKKMQSLMNKNLLNHLHVIVKQKLLNLWKKKELEDLLPMPQQLQLLRNVNM